jgi:hypothetical protein
VQTSGNVDRAAPAGEDGGMRHALPILRSLTAVALSAFVAVCSVAADRYVAQLADGKQVGTSRLAWWPIPGTPIRWGNEDLLTSANPARLVRDREAATLLRPPFLVMANGDVLTGSPIELDRDLSAGREVPRVKVQLEGLMPISGTGVAVRTDRVARIVGSPEAAWREELPPGTVELTDGRRFVARSIKWRERGLAMLTTEGIIEVGFAEIVDAVFPEIDRTAAVLDDSLWAGGTSAGSIVRVHSAGGAILTASRIGREQERSRRRGRFMSNEPMTWYYVQPAWAEQPIAVPERDIAWCGVRPADRAPLALLPGAVTASRRIVGPGGGWNRSLTEGDHLAASGALESDIAISTSAHSELTFDLPAGATSFSAAVGLDRAVGSGGCVRCLVVAESAGGRTLWDSGILVGSDGPKLTGPIDVKGIERLVLIVEAAHEERPPGADPLDIRDQVCWLCPLVQVEFARTERLPAVLTGLASWQLAGSGLDSGLIASEWNASTLAWDPVLRLSKGQGLTLSRTLQVSAAADVLELRTACPDDLEEHEFQVTVDGQSLSWNTNTERSELRRRLQSYGRERLRAESETGAVSDRLAYWWDLSPWRGKQVTVAVSIAAKRDRNDIAWRGIALRPAIDNLAANGRTLKFDVPLTSLAPSEVRAINERMQPAQNALPVSRGQDRTIRFLGQQFTGGYGMMRESSISFPVQPEYRRFVAVAGCCQQASGPMRLLIDGEVVWERKVTSALRPAQQLDVAVPAGAKTLTLQVGNDGTSYGYAAWTDAGFVK